MMKGYCNSAMCVQVKLAILKTWWKWEKKVGFCFEIGSHFVALTGLELPV